MWHSKKIEEVLTQCNSSKEGLTEKQAAMVLKNNGKNIFPKAKQKSLFNIILSQFRNSIVIILLVAIVFSLIIGENLNAIFIGAVVVINTIIGTFQEYNAEKSAEKLQSMIKMNVTVLRDGMKTLVDSENIVVGDIVFLESGNKVPADIRLIEVNGLKVDESILTGESHEIEKTAQIEKIKGLCHKNMAYAGTLVLTGRAMGVVVGTSLNTELGKIAHNVITLDDGLSPLVLRINKFSKQISIMFAALILVLSVILYIKGYIIKEIFFSVIALTVSAIPEGLSTAMTISLSISSKRMAKNNVIVKKLSAVESLGSCTVIASDKTGTLTVNQQTAKVIKLPYAPEIEVTGEGYNDNGEILIEKNNLVKKHINLITKLGVLNNEGELKKVDGVWKRYGDSIDVAFLSLGLKNNIIKDAFKDLKIEAQIPYESEKKYSAVYYTEEKEDYITAKGSCETILNFCSKMISKNSVVNINKEEILSQVEDLSAKGYRVIAIAYSKGKIVSFTNENLINYHDMIFIGLVGFIDPVRPEAIKAVKECSKAGIKVYMITGDHPVTALHIGKKLKIASSKKQVTTGDVLEIEYNKGLENFDKFIKTVTICARVSPIQKLQIVESLKRQGEFVAVTGDGVNDTPALKTANIGVAMGSGTDLAKETGDMIIADDNFASIVHGVKEGRLAYNNIRSVIYMLLSTGFSEVILYVMSILLNLPFPLIAIQFLWLNLITNGIESNAMAFEKSAEDVMLEKVKSNKDQIFNKLFIQETVLSSAIISTIALILYVLLYKGLNMDISVVRTYLLTFLVFAEDVHVFNCRSEKLSAFKSPIKNNYFVVITIIASVIIQTSLIYIAGARNLFELTQIPFMHVIYILLLTIPVVLAMEVFKLIKNKKNKKIPTK